MGITKHQAEVAIIVIGLAAIAVIAPINISRSRKQLKAGSSEPAKSEPRKAPPAVDLSAPASTAGNKSGQEASLEKPVGRDPFAMPSRTTEAAIVKISPLVLKGISVRKGSEPVALIGSAIVRKGGTVRDAEVVEIGKDYVLVRRDGKEYKLTLEKGR